MPVGHPDWTPVNRLFLGQTIDHQSGTLANGGSALFTYTADQCLDALVIDAACGPGVDLGVNVFDPAGNTAYGEWWRWVGGEGRYPLPVQPIGGQVQVSVQNYDATNGRTYDFTVLGYIGTTAAVMRPRKFVQSVRQLATPAGTNGATIVIPCAPAFDRLALSGFGVQTTTVRVRRNFGIGGIGTTNTAPEEVLVTNAAQVIGHAEVPIDCPSIVATVFNTGAVASDTLLTVMAFNQR